MPWEPDARIPGFQVWGNPLHSLDKVPVHTQSGLEPILCGTGCYRCLCASVSPILAHAVITLLTPWTLGQTVCAHSMPEVAF